MPQYGKIVLVNIPNKNLNRGSNNNKTILKNFKTLESKHIFRSSIGQNKKKNNLHVDIRNELICRI